MADTIDIKAIDDLILQRVPKKDLDAMSEDDKNVLRQTLIDLSKGDEKLYNDLRYSDYSEVPVDILTFVDDPQYLGKAWGDEETGKSKLYPYWRKRLLEMFPDNITTNYNNAILTGCRGIGKTEIAVTISLYLMYRVMCLKKPREYFGLTSHDTIMFAFMNITQKAVLDIADRKFQEMVMSSPWFKARGTISMRSEPPRWKPPTYINIIIGSEPHDVRGKPILYCFLDEVNFVRNQDVEAQKRKALDIVNTAMASINTRFIYKGKNRGIMILASSKRSEQSFLETYTKKQMEADSNNVFIVDEPIWVVKPRETYHDETFQVAVGNKFLASQIIDENDDSLKYLDKGYRIIDVPIDFKPDFIKDMDRCLCDYAGISSTDLSKYISGEKWALTRNDTLQNPFTQEIIQVGQDDPLQYRDFFDIDRVDRRMMTRPLYVHMDMSVSGDKTGIAGVWIRSKRMSQEGRSQSDDLTFQLAFCVSIEAPRGKQISFEKNRQFIYWLKGRGFNLKGVSTDSFQSSDMAQTLKAKGYNYSQISVDRTEKVKDTYICKPYQYFKNCIYEKRLITFRDEKLTNEIIELERNINNGKVDHPLGGCFTGDTKVNLCDGRDLTFSQLVDEFNIGVDNWVFSINLKTKKWEPDMIVNAQLTRENAELVEVTLSSKNVLRCTPDHRFMLLDGSYTEACKLIPGTELMSRDRLKVVSIIPLDYKEDVYDITTEHNHNFMLASGVVVHNSKDSADAVCASLYNASQNAEEFAYNFGEELNETLEANDISTSSDSSKKQIQVAFEEEMREYFKPSSIKRLQKEEEKKHGDQEVVKPRNQPQIQNGMFYW